MNTRKIAMLAVATLLLSLASGCGGDKALDLEGLNLGKDLTGMLGEATQLLGGITDLDSAKAALPKLTELDGGLDEIVSKASQLSPESLESFQGMAMKAAPALEKAVGKLRSMPGVGETLKPTLDSILGKVQGLT